MAGIRLLLIVLIVSRSTLVTIKVTADAMLGNAEKGDLLFSNGGMSQDEDLIGNCSEVECLTTKFLESNNVEPHITHVQGHLKQSYSFWKDVLHTLPPYIGLYRKWLSSSI